MSNVGSLYDVSATVDKLMAQQYIKYYQLKTEKSAEQIQITAYGTLKSLFETFQGKMKSLTDSFETVAYQALSSNSSVLSASVTGNSVGAGSHTVVVTKLAQAQQFNTLANFSSRTAALGINETLTFTNAADSAKKFSISVAAGDSLEAIRDKINNSTSNMGMSASIVASTGVGGATQYNLVLTNQQGTANQVNITGDTGNYFQFSQVATAQNAEFTFDGFNEIRSSNTITDVMDGLNFTLSGLGTSVITTSANNVDLNSAVQTAVTDMLASYNQLITFLDGNKYVTSKDDTNKQKTTKVNTDFSFIKSRLEQAANTVFNVSSSVHDLRTAGITLSPSKEVKDQYDADRDPIMSTGSLMINTAPKAGSPSMTDLLKNDFAGVKEYFNSGFIANVNKAINDGILYKDPVGVKPGLIQSATDRIGKTQTTTDNQIQSETVRLGKVRDNLIDQFSRLNAMISKYQNISDYLDKQYSQLGNFLSNK